MSFSKNGNANEIIEEDEEDVDDDYEGECYYCGTQLDAQFNYFCISRERQACDNCCDACNAESCDYISCSRCIDLHYSETHP